jgi:glycogen debranching enzyme
VEGSVVVLGYEGLDGVVRTSRLECSPPPSEVVDNAIRFTMSLAPKSEASFDLVLSCSTGESRDPLSFDSATAEAARALAATSRGDAEVISSNPQFNDWLQRSLADIHMMVSSTSHGPYPCAGVPWFSTIFGRDGVITALELLWFNPELARGVLSFLAASQAKETNPAEDAEPGKILHEIRKGEMAALGEIPFGRYYGSVDATPLFVLLAGAYLKRSGDLELIRALWPAIERALAWIDDHGDADGDGFVEYTRRSPAGLLHQGWKDSNDSIFHADGSLAEGPIAVCEVQAYVYGARRAAASMARRLGLRSEQEANERKGEALRAAFERAFWSKELKSYALALDGEKRPCLVRSSNAGQCLFTGIASPRRARRVADMLLGDDLFSGWGIRTVAASEIRHDPMSYHNGSVWPHDNALIAAGFDRYGFKEDVSRVLSALYEASLFVDLHRLPELLCGFTRRPGEGPTLYPVACSPQAWSAGAAFSLVQSALGLSIDGRRRRLCLSHPVLPSFLDTLELRNVAVGSGSVDLLVVRHREDVGINVTRRKGDVEIVIVK